MATRQQKEKICLDIIKTGDFLKFYELVEKTIVSYNQMFKEHRNITETEIEILKKYIKEFSDKVRKEEIYSALEVFLAMDTFCSGVIIRPDHSKVKRWKAYRKILREAVGKGKTAEELREELSQRLKKADNTLKVTYDGVGLHICDYQNKEDVAGIVNEIEGCKDLYMEKIQEFLSLESISSYLKIIFERESNKLKCKKDTNPYWVKAKEILRNVAESKPPDPQCEDNRILII